MWKGSQALQEWHSPANTYDGVKGQVNHTIIWVGKSLKDYLAPPPCHGLGCHLLDQVAQSPTLPGL